MSRLPLGAIAALCIALSPASLVQAAGSVDTLDVDLVSLIQQVAGNPQQFAVNVPHQVSVSSHGAWSQAGDRRTWRYSMRIADAVSLSFHATRLRLPPSAVLTVRSAMTTTTYRADEVESGELWSRVQPGEALEFALDVTAAEQVQVELEITAFQAGYRGLSPSVRSHAYFRRVQAMAAGDAEAACAQNYACAITPGNAAAAQATVGLLIGNLYSCTGTMVNNTAHDNTPYLLTARHCQSNYNGGSDPGAASAVVVYWNAQAPCGQLLGDVFYASVAPRQTGATTVVMQQDTWLMRLDDFPIVSDAQYAGFDATGAQLDGGYTVHHARAYSRQLTRWFGRPFASSRAIGSGNPYVFDLLGTVNEYGVVGPGASGAALFSPDDQVAGVLSLARVGGSSSGYGACPATAPVAPAADSSVANFNSLAAIWNSTADATSPTGSRTLRSVLDPIGTGSGKIAGIPAARMNLQGWPKILDLNAQSMLEWNVPNALSCTAIGGESVQGWDGPKPPSGTAFVTRATEGAADLVLRCQLPGSATIQRSLRVEWRIPVARPGIFFERNTVWATRPVVLSWNSNVGPCSISGGDLEESGLAASGSIQTTWATPGTVTYTVTCGVPGRTGSASQPAYFVEPEMRLASRGTVRKLGEPVSIVWATHGDGCRLFGGAPGDGWTGNYPQYSNFNVLTTRTGAVDYGVSCYSGPLVVEKVIRIMVEDVAPYILLEPVVTNSRLSFTPADYIHIRFRSNLDFCLQRTEGPLPRAVIGDDPYGLVPSDRRTEGDWIFAPGFSGTGSLTIECWPALSTSAERVSATMPFTVTAAQNPTATLTSNATSVTPGGSFDLQWSSTDSRDCTASSSPYWIPGWHSAIGASGSKSVQAGNSQFGDLDLRITCYGLDGTQTPAVATVRVSFLSPGMELRGSQSTVEAGKSFSLNWSVPGASGCQASGGGANGSPWAGSLAATGSTTQTASVQGAHTYTLSCSINGLVPSSSFTVTVVPSGSSGGGSGSGGGNPASGDSGGGGSLGPDLLLPLGLLAFRTRRRRYLQLKFGKDTQRGGYGLQRWTPGSQ